MMDLQKFESEFQRLKVSIKYIQSLSEELNKQVAAKFNIFSLLSVAHKEVNTHSALLADLLNPEGTHGQKHLFLDTFLQMCVSKHPGFPIKYITGNAWFIEKEKVTSYGNMDLVISSPDLKSLLVIENKVWASDQEEQLQRYWKWMKDQDDLYQNKALVYLTPTGSDPSEKMVDGHFFKLSYHEDISCWLESSFVDVKAPRVKETITQYLEVIKTL